jgi:protein-arginine kinase activator protein McsA
MKAKAANLEFERAAMIRDEIKRIKGKGPRAKGKG